MSQMIKPENPPVVIEKVFPVTPPILISFVVPVLNEQDNVLPLYHRVCEVMSPFKDRYSFEIVFTDNHSMDATFERIRSLAVADPRVRVLRFSRNFGYQRSILTGYRHARGQAAVQLDADLQDPPDMIPEFLKLWREGYQVVYGIRRSRQESFLMQTARQVFYRLINSLSEDELPHDAGDFRLVGRPILDELLKIEDSQPYLRGALASLGFRQVGIPYDRGARSRGESKFSLRDLVGLGLDGILNHSVIPLRLATYTGLGTAALSIVALFGYVIGKFWFGQNWPAGFTTLTILILLCTSLNAFFFGVMGEYIGRMYIQVKKRPLSVIENSINFEGTVKQ